MPALAATVGSTEQPHGDTQSHSTGQAAAHPAAPPNAPAVRSAAPRPAARPPADGSGRLLDMRHYHGRYYPPLGTVTPTLPTDYRPYYRAGHRYYLAGGTWYAPRGGGFCVVAPPVGLVIAVLPLYYTTVWANGIPYYYANNAYYTAQPDQNGYAVVDPPENVDPNSPSPDGGDGAPGQAPPYPMGGSDFIIYPKNGQSKDQQAADEYECNNWARTQTGFDPTQPGGGVPEDQADIRHSYFDRALSACLLGRGYQLN